MTTLGGEQHPKRVTMAAVIPFTTIEGVISALAKIDVMHKHMASTSEGKVHEHPEPRASGGFLGGSNPPPYASDPYRGSSTAKSLG